MNKSDQATHFNQEARRKADFIRPPNLLKAKVGSGGLTDDVLTKAQKLLENTGINFQPLAEMYLQTLEKAIDSARQRGPDFDPEAAITAMLYPAVQLKANGGMFHYPLVTSVADKLVQFLEVLAEPDDDALEIVAAFHTTVRAIVTGRVAGDGGRYGMELMAALSDACLRYFDRFPYRRQDL